MNILIQRPALMSILGPAANIADPRSTIPVVGNALLRATADGTLSIAATDLVVSIAGTVTCDVKAPGDVTLSAKRLAEVVKNAPDDTISIKVGDGNRAEVKSGKSKATLVGLPAADFPRLPDAAPVTFGEVAGKAFASLLARARITVSTETDRVHMSGVYVESDGESCTVASTDSNRFTMLTPKMPIPKTGGPPECPGVILPPQALPEIIRMCEDAACFVGFGERHAFVRVGTLTLSAQLVQAQFPPFRRVLAEVRKVITSRLTVDRGTLLSALQRCAVMAPTKTSWINCTVEDGKIQLVSKMAEVGESEEDVAADTTGNRCFTGLNVRFMIEALACMAGDEVTIEHGDDDIAPFLMVPKADPVHMAIVMPLRP